MREPLKYAFLYFLANAVGIRSPFNAAYREGLALIHYAVGAEIVFLTAK